MASMGINSRATASLSPADAFSGMDDQTEGTLVLRRTFDLARARRVSADDLTQWNEWRAVSNERHAQVSLSTGWSARAV